MINIEKLSETHNTISHKAVKDYKLECCGKRPKSLDDGQDWVAFYQCENCGLVYEVGYADHMSGNHNDDVTVYKRK